MADLPADSSQPESNNFDNDFEKLNFSPQQEQTDDLLVSSTTQPQADLPEEDLYSPSPEVVPSGNSGYSEAEPLVNLTEVEPVEPPPPAEPFLQPTPPPVTSAPLIPEPDSASSVTKPPSTPEAKSEKSVSQGPGAWLKSIDPRAEAQHTPASDDSDFEESPSLAQPVVDLIYWRDVTKTGIVFGSLMVLLLSLALFSVLSVLAYLSLAALTVTLSFRIYKNVLGAVQKTGEGHPFKEYLDVDIALPEEKVHDVADVVMKHGSCCLKELRRLFLVEDIVDSLKFGLLLWVLTYIGAWFNGMTLIILDVVGVFTLPKVYETYKVQIDQYVDLAKTHIKNVVKQVQDKIPLGKKKTQ